MQYNRCVFIKNDIVSMKTYSCIDEGLTLSSPDFSVGYHQLINMKLGLSHYSHKSMPDAKFEAGSFSILGDMTSQKFHSEELNRSSNSEVYSSEMGSIF